VALLIGLYAVGIDLTAFAVFSGAVGVGIGFGLQKIVSNFVSGIILLLERSIKPGDVIEVGSTFGAVTYLGALCLCARTGPSAKAFCSMPQVPEPPSLGVASSSLLFCQEQRAETIRGLRPSVDFSCG
jgi:hypothetical protein